MKKLIIAAVAASVAATGFAGSYAAPAASKSAPTANTYVELAGGYARTNFANHNGSTDAYDHGNGGFAGGMDAGYTFLPHLGVEAGFMMPFQKAKNKASKGKVSQYSFYVAARIDANVGHGFNVFILGGVDYTHQKDDTATTALTSHGFGFVGGFGANYAFNDGFTVGAKYLRLAGKVKKSTTEPSFANPQYYLVTVGYQINM